MRASILPPPEPEPLPLPTRSGESLASFRVSFLSLPYERFLAPLAPFLLSALALVCLVWIACDWLTASRGTSNRGLASLASVALLLLAGRWLFEPAAAAAVGLLLAAHAVALYALARADGPALEPSGRPAAIWPGLAIIALAFAVKCVSLEEWPPHLNEYSAWTGLQGIDALDGFWPEDFFQGKEYDLVNGGRSPLMLPVLWLTMKCFGGTIFAIRFAEVVGSTLLLLFLWLWLRAHLHGGWGLLALAIFAFSPWHLAQSRMGSFLSISAALALAMLLLAERIVVRRHARTLCWVGFGLTAGLLGYGYAPVKVLYAFFFIILAVATLQSWRAGDRHRSAGPGLALAVFLLLLAVQIWDFTRIDQMFRHDFGSLATDTSIWHKTSDDVVSKEIQPLGTIIENLFRNASTWMRRSYEEATILSWYAPASSIGILTAAVALLRGREWVGALYFLIGILPPLLIFPVDRRSLIAWPFVYVAGVLFTRQLVVDADRISPRAWWRMGCRAVAIGALIGFSLHGLHLFATTNSIVRAGTYFGPDHRLDMLLEAERLFPECHLYFVNLDSAAVPVVHVRLYEPGRKLEWQSDYFFLTLEEGQQEIADLKRDRPACFFYLVEDGDDGIMRMLREILPGGTLVRRVSQEEEGMVLYSVYFYSEAESTE